MFRYIYFILFILIASSLYGQQIRYVDTKYILSQMPQYTEAKSRLANQVNLWKEEITKEQTAIEDLKLTFENEKIILTPEKIKEKQAEIEARNKSLNDKIENRFGANGEVIRMQENLVKPIQDQIWTAINTLSQKNRYDLVIDKNSGTTLIYTNTKYDITPSVIKELGINEKESGKNDVKPINNNNQSIGAKPSSQQRSNAVESKKTITEKEKN